MWLVKADVVGERLRVLSEMVNCSPCITATAIKDSIGIEPAVFFAVLVFFAVFIFLLSRLSIYCTGSLWQSHASLQI